MCVLVGLVALMVGTWVSPPHGMAQNTEPGVRVLGSLPEPDQTGNIVAFDTEGDRMFYVHRIAQGSTQDNWLTVYDLTATIPKIVADVFLGTALESLGSHSTATWAYDSGRDVLYQLGIRPPPTGNPGQGGLSVADQIRQVNLDNLDQPDEDPPTSRFDRIWDLADKGGPGFRARGFTYAPEDDRIYLIGRYEAALITAPSILASGVTGVAEDVTVVMAFDLGTEEIAWQRVVPECPAPGQYQVPRFAQIYRATHRDALYFFCTAGGGLSGVEAYPGEPGVVSLGISDDATQDDAVGFPVEYFPVSGQYGTELAATVFDPVTDRLFVTSLSRKTPGAFVFDGRLTAWIGKVAAPNRGGDELALSPASGRLYLAGSGLSGGLEPPDEPNTAGAFLTVSEARATPPPQGTTYALNWQDDLDWSESIAWSAGDPKSRHLPVLSHGLIADATRNRIFYRNKGLKTDPATGERFAEGLWVLEDTTPLISEGDPVVYDLLTDDVAEGPDTFRNFNGNTAGFGSLVRLVGGVEDFASYSSSLSSTASEAIGLVFQPNNGDRSVAGGLVRSTNVSTFEASAGAQALRADQATSGDVEAAQTEAGQDPQPLPHQLVECSDGGIDPGTETDRDEVGSGHAEVTCDLSKELVVAEASHRAGTTEPDVDTLTVAASHFTTDVHRDPDLGIVTTSVATAEGIQLPVPGVGAVHIGYVQSTATTAAAGRTGTSTARWTRVIDGLRLVDAGGQQQYPPEGSAPTSCATVFTADGHATQQVGSCQAFFNGLNDLLQTQVQFRLGTPDLVATPKGAYAQVWEPEAEFLNGQTVMGDDSRAVSALEAVIFADGTEKSRLVIQLAAVKADSLYTITHFPTFDPGPEATEPATTPPSDDPTPRHTDEPTDPPPTDDATDQVTQVPTPAPTSTEPAMGRDDGVVVADLSGTGGDAGQGQSPVQQVTIPTQPTITQPQPTPEDGAEQPAVAPSETTAAPARGLLALLTLPGWHAARIFGVWALFAAALVVAGRRGLLLQTTTGASP